MRPPIDDEAAIFLRAMAQLQTPPDKDREMSRPSVAQPRRRSRRRRLADTDAMLDLHGLDRTQARARLASAVMQARRRGDRTLLVITGKGTRSPGGVGVLKSVVTSWVRQAGRSTVESFEPAPKRLGGSGALVLYLARR